MWLSLLLSRKSGKFEWKPSPVDRFWLHDFHHCFHEVLKIYVQLSQSQAYLWNSLVSHWVKISCTTHHGFELYSSRAGNTFCIWGKSFQSSDGVFDSTVCFQKQIPQQNARRFRRQLSVSLSSSLRPLAPELKRNKLRLYIFVCPQKWKVYRTEVK